MTFRDDMPLGEAREILRGLAGDGAKCPCCTQLVKVYERRLTSVAARAIAALYAEHHLDFGHLPTVARKHLPDVAHQGGYLTLGAHWGLIEDERRRPDGGRTGYWRVTLTGEEWLQGTIAVPKYARIYDGRCLGLHGDLVRREDALGEGFDFARLMRPVAGISPDGQSALFPTPRGHHQEAA